MQIFSLILLLFPYISLAADQENAAILAQAGCFRVTYESRETGTYNPDYPIHSRYFRTQATELVIPDYVSEDEVMLKHVTSFGGQGENHWGQSWKRNPVRVTKYKGDLLWESQEVAEPLGKWSQYVTEVDDSPRYGCAADWKIFGGVREWACTTWSPIPRREFGRNDYNVLERGNRHIVTPTGWIHHQENRKLMVKNGSIVPIATELTINTYDRIPEVECVAAADHWKKFGPLWRLVRGVWAEIIAAHPQLKYKSNLVDGKTLWMHLFDLVEQQQDMPAEDLLFKNKIRNAIASFLEK